jgi:hypothetical protein
VFHEFSGWLNAEAKVNIEHIFVTEEVSHESRGWLKAEAYQNI